MCTIYFSVYHPDHHNLAFAVKTGPSKVKQDPYEKEDPKAEVECDRCGAKIKGKRNVTRHILTVHEKVKTFPCPECDMLFGAKQTMQRHFVNVHKGEIIDIQGKDIYT